MKNYLMNKILWFLFLTAILLFIFYWPSIQERDKAHNKYMCAVYGYYEDCKTPLKIEDRLK